MLRTWTWEEFRALPSEPVTANIHCVTRWSKLDTTWEGVSVDTLLDEVDHDAGHVLAFCDGGYTTTYRWRTCLPTRCDVRTHAQRRGTRRPSTAGRSPGRAPPLLLEERQVGARDEFLAQDEPGFWEDAGYHMRGDPWKEERYSGD